MTILRGVFQRRSITALAAPPEATGDPRVQHIHSLGPERVVLPPMVLGRTFLENWVVREVPTPGAWRETAYESFAPPVFVLHGALVHSSAGLLLSESFVVEETLVHTAPDQHGYRMLPGAITVETPRVERLDGVWISLLAGASGDLRHAMLDGIARLSCLPRSVITAARGILLPRGGIAQRDMLQLLDLLPTLRLREVAPRETLCVQSLVYPLSVTGGQALHPCLGGFFRAISANVAGGGRRSRRLIIDQTGAGGIAPRNQREVIASLLPHGFQPVRLEGMSVPEQIALFRGAETIVAPHGPALTMLGFCSPTCRVIELQKDSRVDWTFRNLAALAGLRYDCVLGRAVRPWPATENGLHHAEWDVSAQHVLAASIATQDRLQTFGARAIGRAA